MMDTTRADALPVVTLAQARRYHERLIARAGADPTRSAATLATVIAQHGPVAEPAVTSDPPVGGPVLCAHCPTRYPCPTTALIGSGLRIPEVAWC